MAISAIFALLSGAIWVVFGLAAALFPVAASALLLLFAAALPKRLSYFRCQVTKDEIHVTSALLKIKERTIPLGSIQFLEITQTPLERLLDLSTITIYLAGARTRLYTLSHQEAEQLLRLLKGE